MNDLQKIIDPIEDKALYDIITTVHHNACVNTIKVCKLQWNINDDVIYPPHPAIDPIRKQ